MLSGSSADAATLDKAVVIARQFAPDVINMVQVLQPQQVMLEVRFVEATRQAGRALGIQWNSFGQNTLANIGNRVPARQLPVPADAIVSAVRDLRPVRRWQGRTGFRKGPHDLGRRTKAMQMGRISTPVRTAQRGSSADGLRLTLRRSPDAPFVQGVRLAPSLRPGHSPPA